MAAVDVDAGVGLFGSSAAVHLRAVPPPVWVLAAAILGVGVLLFHQYTQTPDDVSWTNPEQPPMNLPVGISVPPAVAGSDWGTHAMRGRAARRFSLWPFDANDASVGAWANIPATGRVEAQTWDGQL